ncbi:MAG: Nif3-like dinuclear metal center hexameric protein [Patescibacteria group bacterium]
MTIQQIYELAIKKAMQADLRGEKVVLAKLKKRKQQYDELTAKEKKYFDKETLANPYADSRVFATNVNKKIKKVLTGIDIDTGEVLLAKHLNADLIISHHPIGIALAGLDEVMKMQVELLALEGIPINIAQSLMQVRMSEVSRSVGVINHYKSIDAAKLLDMPIMCTHTLADNLVTRYLYDLFQKNSKQISTVGDALELLMEIPEYQIASTRKAGPKIFVGNKDNYAGRIAILEMTGGTNGSKDIYEKMAHAGIGTIIGMHMSEEWKKQAEKNHINVIIAGHISSDSLGMNLLLDELEKKGIEVIVCSGIIRYKRYKK